MNAIACLVSQRKLLGSPDNLGACVLEPRQMSEFMALDAAAVRALNLLPDPRDPTRLGSLHQVLAAGCLTKGGARLLRKWVVQPLMQVDSIRARQACVEALVDDNALRDGLACLKVSPNTHSHDTAMACLTPGYCAQRNVLGFSRHPMWSALRPACSASQRRWATLYRSSSLHSVCPTLRPFCGPTRAATPPSWRSSLQPSWSALQPSSSPLSPWRTRLSTWTEHSAASECYCYATVTSFSPSSSCCSYSRPSLLVRFVINPSWDDNLEELAQQRTEVEQAIMAEFERAQSLASTMDIKCENDARRGVVMRTARSNDKKLRKLMG